MASHRLPITALALACAAILAAGCANEEAAEEERPITVVATTTQVADMVREVAGGRATVRALMAAGADPHDFELRPSDLDALSGADLVVRSGGEVDEWTQEAIEAAGAEASVVSLLDHVDQTANRSDPHWWHDPRNGVRAVEALRDAMAEADPAGEALYGRSASSYARRLRRLDAAIARCWSRIAPERRKLVTTHDALGHYARRYGLQVVGAVLPSTSTQGQASAGAVDDLIGTIRREKVAVIFTDASADPGVEQAIAADSGARVGDRLYVDSLAAEGPAATYAGSLAANTRAMVEGLGRGEAECELP